MNSPYGGKLVNRLLDSKPAGAYKSKLQALPRWTMTMRQLCDFELLVTGGYSPLEGFMDHVTYENVCSEMRLPGSNLVWPMPVALDVTAEFATGITPNTELILEDAEGVALGVLHVSDVYKPDKEREASQVFGTTDTDHPAVSYLHNNAGEYYIGGTVDAFELPRPYDFPDIRLTPAEVRARFEKQNWQNVVAFQTRNPMHRAHVELTHRACADGSLNLLIHPVVGMTKPGDVDHYTRVRVYKHIVEKYSPSTAMVSLLPLAMRMGGPREAIWHAIIRKNFGCTHFIIGRDHAGPGKDSEDKDFYEPYAAQQLAEKYAPEIGIVIVPFQMMVYTPKLDAYKPINELTKDEVYESISGTESSTAEHRQAFTRMVHVPRGGRRAAAFL